MFSVGHSRMKCFSFNRPSAANSSQQAARPKAVGISGSRASTGFAGKWDTNSALQAVQLRRAAETGDLETLTRILDTGFEPDFEDAAGNKALHLAAGRGFLGAVQALIKAGAEIDALDGSIHQRSPLLLAARRGYLPVVNRLIEAKANIELADKQYGCRPLHHAAMAGHVEVVKRLLSAGAVVNAADRKGATPLALAKAKGHTKIVQLLAQAEADLPQEFSGFPPLAGVVAEDIFLPKRP